MLSRLTLTNFKSYRKASLRFAPLTVLIGANGSGKSNAIEALWLLSQGGAGRSPGCAAEGAARRRRTDPGSAE